MQRGIAWIVDDDSSIRWVLERALTGAGLSCTTFESGNEVLDALTTKTPDVLLSDIRMPGMDGLALLKQIKQRHPMLPVIIMTAHSDLDAAVSAYQQGAFDYLPKPFEPRELLARIRAILRRRGDDFTPASVQAAANVMRFGSLEIDRDARTVSVAGENAELTSYQFDLLVALAERAGRVLTRDQIMEAVRGRELEAFDRSIDVHMGRIRAAIEVDPKAPKRILTVRGVGYVFAKQQD